MKLFQRAFFNARNIGAGDAENICRFFLCAGALAEETVAHDDDLPLPLGQNGLEHSQHFFNLHLAVKILCHRVLAADNIHVSQGIAVAVHIDGFVDRNFTAQFFLRAEVHKDLVRYPLLTARHILTNPR